MNPRRQNPLHWKEDESGTPTMVVDVDKEDWLDFVALFSRKSSINPDALSREEYIRMYRYQGCTVKQATRLWRNRYAPPIGIPGPKLTPHTDLARDIADLGITLAREQGTYPWDSEDHHVFHTILYAFVLRDCLEGTPDDPPPACLSALRFYLEPKLLKDKLTQLRSQIALGPAPCRHLGKMRDTASYYRQSWYPGTPHQHSNGTRYPAAERRKQTLAIIHLALDKLDPITPLTPPVEELQPLDEIGVDLV